MIPMGSSFKNTLEKKLMQHFRRLEKSNQQALLQFAAFLEHSQTLDTATQRTTVAFPTPEPIPRPKQESVVKAIKRLTATYPMIDRDLLLNETSQLMTEHVLHGKSAPQVIDELEALFQQHYTVLKSEYDQNAQ